MYSSGSSMSCTSDAASERLRTPSVKRATAAEYASGTVSSGSAERPGRVEGMFDCMTDNNPAAGTAGPAAKDPDDWTTGDEPMTGPQKSYIETLSQQAGQVAPAETLSKADASKLIDELQTRTGRGN